MNNLLTAGTAGEVTFRAHIDGFARGMILVALFKRPGVRLRNPLRA